MSDYETENEALEAALHAATQPLYAEIRRLYEQTRTDQRALMQRYNIENLAVKLLKEGHKITYERHYDESEYCLDGQYIEPDEPLADDIRVADRLDLIEYDESKRESDNWNSVEYYRLTQIAEAQS